jgi:hypothetical protein
MIFLGKPVRLARLRDCLARYLPLAAPLPESGPVGPGLIVDPFPELPPIDLGHLAAMIGDDPWLQRRMLDRFIGSTRPQLAELNSAIAACDAEGACDTAHSLKGAAQQRRGGAAGGAGLGCGTRLPGRLLGRGRSADGPGRACARPGRNLCCVAAKHNMKAAGERPVRGR